MHAGSLLGHRESTHYSSVSSVETNNNHPPSRLQYVTSSLKSLNSKIHRFIHDCYHRWDIRSTRTENRISSIHNPSATSENNTLLRWLENGTNNSMSIGNATTARADPNSIPSSDALLIKCHDTAQQLTAIIHDWEQQKAPLTQSEPNNATMAAALYNKQIQINILKNIQSLLDQHIQQLKPAKHTVRSKGMVATHSTTHSAAHPATHTNIAITTPVDAKAIDLPTRTYINQCLNTLTGTLERLPIFQQYDTVSDKSSADQYNHTFVFTLKKFILTQLTLSTATNNHLFQIQQSRHDLYHRHFKQWSNIWAFARQLPEAREAVRELNSDTGLPSFPHLASQLLTDVELGKFDRPGKVTVKGSVSTVAKLLESSSLSLENILDKRALTQAQQTIHNLYHSDAAETTSDDLQQLYDTLSTVQPALEQKQINPKISAAQRLVLLRAIETVSIRIEFAAQLLGISRELEVTTLSELLNRCYEIQPYLTSLEAFGSLLGKISEAQHQLTAWQSPLKSIAQISTDHLEPNHHNDLSVLPFSTQWLVLTAHELAAIAAQEQFAQFERQLDTLNAITLCNEAPFIALNHESNEQVHTMALDDASAITLPTTNTLTPHRMGLKRSGTKSSETATFNNSIEQSHGHFTLKHTDADHSAQQDRYLNHAIFQSGGQSDYLSGCQQNFQAKHLTQLSRSPQALSTTPLASWLQNNDYLREAINTPEGKMSLFEAAIWGYLNHYHPGELSGKPVDIGLLKGARGYKEAQLNLNLGHSHARLRPTHGVRDNTPAATLWDWVSGLTVEYAAIPYATLPAKTTWAHTKHYAIHWGSMAGGAVAVHWISQQNKYVHKSFMQFGSALAAIATVGATTTAIAAGGLAGYFVSQWAVLHLSRWVTHPPSRPDTLNQASPEITPPPLEFKRHTNTIQTSLNEASPNISDYMNRWIALIPAEISTGKYQLNAAFEHFRDDSPILTTLASHLTLHAPDMSQNIRAALLQDIKHAQFETAFNTITQFFSTHSHTHHHTHHHNSPLPLIESLIQAAEHRNIRNIVAFMMRALRENRPLNTSEREMLKLWLVQLTSLYRSHAQTIVDQPCTSKLIRSFAEWHRSLEYSHATLDQLTAITQEAVTVQDRSIAPNMPLDANLLRDRQAKWLSNFRKAVKYWADPFEYQAQHCHRIPTQGRAILAVNHGLLTLDLSFFVDWARAVSKRDIRMVVDRQLSRMPVVGSILESVGFHEGNPQNFQSLLIAEKAVTVAPGGMLEAIQPPAYRNILFSDQRLKPNGTVHPGHTGYIKDHITTAAPILNALSPRADDIARTSNGPLSNFIFEKMHIPIGFLNIIHQNRLQVITYVDHPIPAPILPENDLSIRSPLFHQITTIQHRSITDRAIAQMTASDIAFPLQYTGTFDNPIALD